ncbi:MAG: carboxymuconolactone decarboxylase family protein [Planctomycetota bacterium]|nr:carboxymuconolactone decarboxylase family protein [Planctomycetota bacterium]
MPRLNVIDPSTDTGPGADVLNGPLKNMQINIFKGMANNADVLKAFLGFMQGVKAGALTAAEHEIVSLVAAQRRDCQYCLSAHVQLARDAGIDEELSLKIRQGRIENPRHQTLIDFVNAILDTDGDVSDKQLEAFRAAGYDDAAIVEVLGALTVITFTNFFNHLNRTEIDFPVAAAV